VTALRLLRRCFVDLDDIETLFSQLRDYVITRLGFERRGSDFTRE